MMARPVCVSGVRHMLGSAAAGTVVFDALVRLGVDVATGVVGIGVSVVMAGVSVDSAVIGVRVAAVVVGVAVVFVAATVLTVVAEVGVLVVGVLVVVVVVTFVDATASAVVGVGVASVVASVVVGVAVAAVVVAPTCRRRRPPESDMMRPGPNPSLAGANCWLDAPVHFCRTMAVPRALLPPCAPRHIPGADLARIVPSAWKANSSFGAPVQL